MNLALQIDMNQMLSDWDGDAVDELVHSLLLKEGWWCISCDVDAHEYAYMGIYDNTQSRRKEVTPVIVVYFNDNLKSKLTRFTFLMHFTGFIVHESSRHEKKCLSL